MPDCGAAVAVEGQFAVDGNYPKHQGAKQNILGTHGTGDRRPSRRRGPRRQTNLTAECRARISSS